MTEQNSSPTKKRSSLRLPADDHRWWTEEVIRVAHKEKLLKFSLTALMHRIAEADLDLTHAAIIRYQSILHKKKVA